MRAYVENKTIIFDIDGVLLNFHKAFEEYIQRTYPKFSMSKVYTYDFNKSMTEETISRLELPNFCFKPQNNYGLSAKRDYLLESLNEVEIYEKSEPFDSIITILKKLSENGANIILHSYTRSNEVAAYKKKQLNEMFKEIPNIKIIVSVGETKPILKGDIVIEDCIDNLLDYIGTNTKLCLIDMPYNQTLANLEKCMLLSKEGVIRCDNIAQALNKAFNLPKHLKFHQAKTNREELT